MILVTGATGHVGKEVVHTLMQRNADFQMATRRRESKGVYFDFENSSTINLL